MKFLIGSCRAQDIPQVMEARMKLNYDRLDVLYMYPGKAYGILRNFFLKRKEYTHLVIQQGDLLVTDDNIKIIEEDLSYHDFAVLCGCCNVDQDALKDKMITTKNLPHPMYDPLPFRHYDYHTKDEVFGKKIVRVPFAGNCLACIRRDVVEQIPFETDGYINSREHGGNIDVMFAVNCAKAGIPIRVDYSNMMIHLRDQVKHPVIRDPEMEKIIFYNAGSTIPHRLNLEEI